MKKIFTPLLVTMFFVSSICAQEMEGIAGFIKAGYMNAPASGRIFSRIAPSGISGFTDNFFLFGAEAYYRKAKNIYNIEGHMGVQKAYAYATTYAEPFCGAAHANFGKVITENQHYWLYPSVGAGASLMQLLTYQEVNKRVDNIKEKTLVSPSFELGINADFLLSKSNREKNFYLGNMLGIRAGYRVSINSSKWKYENEVKPYSMPAYANNAFYLSLSIGGGSFDKN